MDLNDFSIEKLGGGFNPFQKYQSNWIISPGKGKNKKYLKPPPRKIEKKPQLFTPQLVIFPASVALLCFAAGWPWPVASRHAQARSWQGQGWPLHHANLGRLDDDEVYGLEGRCQTPPWRIPMGRVWYIYRSMNGYVGIYASPMDPSWDLLSAKTRQKVLWQLGRLEGLGRFLSLGAHAGYLSITWRIHISFVIGGHACRHLWRSTE